MGSICVHYSYLLLNLSVSVSSWVKSHNLKSFGMPLMHGHGSHEGDKSKCRFLVMDRFSRDLDTYLKSCNKILPLSTVFQLSVQIVSVMCKSMHCYVIFRIGKHLSVVFPL